MFSTEQLTIYLFYFHPPLYILKAKESGVSEKAGGGEPQPHLKDSKEELCSKRKREIHEKDPEGHEQEEGGQVAIPPPRKRVFQISEEDKEKKREMWGSSRALFDKVRFEQGFDHSAFLKTLPEEDQGIYESNPHLRQVFVQGYDFHKAKKPFSLRDRLLRADSGRTLRRARGGEVKTVEHWGQRKLLLSEIELLTTFYEEESTVLYAGAAPGTHTNFLSAALFPDLRFVLIDPMDFDAWETSRIKIRKELFTDEIAREYAGCKIFISDIRSTTVDKMENADREEQVLNEMKMQHEWLKIMQPKAAMLKFCLPYDHEKYPIVKYAGGDIYLPIWGPRTTSETRLIVTNPNLEVAYDTEDYDNAMFHFNTVTRVTYYEHEQLAEGYDHCYDCTAESFVLKAYLRKVENITEESVLEIGADYLADYISDHIGRFRKGLNLGGKKNS